MNMRPATIQEIADIFGASLQGTRTALLEQVAEGKIVKVYGARGYMPAWARRAIAEEGLRRIEDPVVREKMLSVINPPIRVRVTDCFRRSFMKTEILFPNPSTPQTRHEIASEAMDGRPYIVDAILPNGSSWDVVVHRIRCECDRECLNWVCDQCGRWVCDDCVHVHPCR